MGAMYKAMTGEDLERVVYGKPGGATYKYADEILMQWMDIIHNEERLPENVYMIGDNPASDNFGVFKNVLEAIKTVMKKELGEEFKFEWKDERVNPLLQSNGAGSEAVAVE